jgi:ATP diphosphatase
MAHFPRGQAMMKDEMGQGGEASNDLAPRRGLADLVAVMAALRAPVTGCPWDLEQSFATIAPFTIEEAYEVADAIERGNRADLKEELGDLLLQVVYHAQLAKEEGAFAIEDVIDGITRKMIRRHPHVFDGEAARSAGAAKGFWEKIKAAEKASNSAEGKSGAADPKLSGVLANVPLAMPALTRAVKLQAKAAKVGFDWPDLTPVFAKLEEEIAELKQALAGSHPADGGAIEEELGDVLFVIANIARHLKVDPELALRGTNAKFVRRFERIEGRLRERGRSPAQSSLAEMDALWKEAKAKE